MSEHVAMVDWTRNTPGFAYPDYNREHSWRFENGIEIPASAAPGFLGSEDHVDPEEAYVAAVSSCHMLTFLAICAKKRIVVNEYRDRAVGMLEKNEQGSLSVTRIELSPRISFGGDPPDRASMEHIHHLSHKQCFIANSIRTEVNVARLF